MGLDTRYSHIFPTRPPHTETVSRTHKSCLLQRVGHTRVWVSEGRLGERCLSRYRTEKSHTVILLSISIDYTMDTRSCNPSSEKNKRFRRSLIRLFIQGHLVYQRQRDHRQQVPVNVLDTLDDLFLHPEGHGERRDDFVS
jgi:hypothetical protein